MRPTHKATGAQWICNLLFGGKLEEQNAGAGKHRSGKHKSGAENQRDAVLRSLEANESNGGENKRQQAGYDLQIAL